jgi:hypothetical protein
MASAGASHADASTCSSLSLGAGAPAGGGELTDASFVSAGRSSALGDIGSAAHANRSLIERFNGPGWAVVPSPIQLTRITASTAFPLVLAEDGRSAAHSSLGRISRSPCDGTESSGRWGRAWLSRQRDAGTLASRSAWAAGWRCPGMAVAGATHRFRHRVAGRGQGDRPGQCAGGGAPAAQPRSAARCSLCSSAGRHG